MRADAFLTLNLVHPLRKLVPSKGMRVPILMYHGISAMDESEKAHYYRTCTHPRVFREQIGFLARAGYRTLGLNEAIQMIAGTTTYSERSVVITFDDGLLDFYTEAFPVLNSYGYSATVFLPTGFVGDFPQRFQGAECLTWGQALELQASGIEFGSHTVNHPQLRTLSMNEVQHEIRCSKETIEDKLGSRVDSFSYPFAFPDADRTFRVRLREMLTASGYQNGVSTIIGTANRSSDRFFLERLPVNSEDGAGLFTAKLQGGYDWLHAFQLASKLRLTRMSVR